MALALARGRATRSGRPGLAVLLAVAIAAPEPARAFVYEEFEVFAPPRGPAGGFEVDQHLNYGLRGRLRPGEPGALATQGGTYLNTEISYGVAPWYALSLEIPAAITRDGRLHPGGFKLRNLFALSGTPAWSTGVLVEIQRQPRGFLPNPWGVALSPLVAWRDGRWGVVANAGFGVSFGARGSDSRFAPAARVSYAAAEGITLGAEYYGELGRVERWERLPGQAHQVLAVAEIELGAVGVRVGVGRGLTPASDRWVGTVVVGFGF